MTQTPALAEVCTVVERPRDAVAVHAREVDYRADVDGLRAVAVLAVLGFHAFPGFFPGGFVGVDVFFVISGFLISSIIFKQLKCGRFTLADFYSRRVRRIFPALAAILVVCLLFGWYALLPDELDLLGKHVGAASLFISNFVSWQEIGYFDRAAALKPLLHLWSLGIEEQFYLVWPLLLMLLWRRRGTIGVTITLLTLASFTLNVVLVHRSPSADYYFPIARFWELGVGCLLASLKQSASSRTQQAASGASGTPARAPRLGLRELVPIAGIVLILISLFSFDIHTPFPGWAGLLPTCGAACVLAAPGDSWFQRYVIGHPVLVFIGLISYPLYLWHWPLLSFATILAAETPATTIRVVAVLLSVLLAWLTYRFIELPIRKQGRWRASLALVAGLALLGLAGLAIYAAAGVDSRFKVDIRAIRQGPRTDSRCLADFPGARQGVVNYCKATGAASPQAVFMGDSRTQAVYDGTVAVVGPDYPMMLLARGGCPPLLHAHIDNDSKEQSCNDTWNRLAQFVQTTKPRVVVLVGGGSRYFVPQSADGSPMGAASSASAPQGFGDALADLIGTLQKTSRVIYVREIPGYGSSPDCFLRRVRLPGNGCSPDAERSKVEASLAAYNHALDEIHSRFPQLALVDSIPVLCSPSTCSQRLPSGEVIYSDQLHLSPAGARLFVTGSGLSAMITAALGAASLSGP